MTDSFAERLARALDARDVKQVELAEKTGISKSAISQLIRSQMLYPPQSPPLAGA